MTRDAARRACEYAAARGASVRQAAVIMAIEDAGGVMDSVAALRAAGYRVSDSGGDSILASLTLLEPRLYEGLDGAGRVVLGLLGDA